MAQDTKRGIQWAGDVPTSDQHRAKRIVMMYNGSGAAIAAGNCVAIDRSVTTKGADVACKVTPANAQGLLDAVGGAVYGIPNGEWGQVQVAGVQELANVADAVVAGNLLIADVANAGRLVVTPVGMTSDDAVLLGRALTDGTAGNTATVEWFNPANL